MIVLDREGYVWLDRPVLSEGAAAFWDWLDAALDTLNRQAPDDAVSVADRLNATVALITHARRVHACRYRTDDLGGPCLAGRLIAESLQPSVPTGYDEAWRVAVPQVVVPEETG